ncbi:MAG: DUF4105 domain-containing protein [Gemmatimonas sp.]
MSSQLSWLRRVAVATLASALLLASPVPNGHAQALDQQPGAQTPPPAPPGESSALDSTRAIRGANLVVSIVTYGASDDEVWERFGHDALEIHDTLTGQDYVYNWGMFSWGIPHIVIRFLAGDANYWLTPFATGALNADYVDHRRSIRVQRLALTAAERGALLDYVIWNSQEANKFYRYDYYQDNCATRVRDAIDRVLKGRLKAALDTTKTSLTWRSETERVTASDFLVYSGIELALGRNADKPMTAWQASFMPERLADAITAVILKNETGQRYSLTQSDTVIYASDRVPMPTDPPDRIAMAALLGLTLAGLIALFADSRFTALRGLLVAFATLWYLVGGVLGTALLLAGTVTKHTPYMGANTTLWQIHPLLLFAALFVPVALYRRQTTQIPRILVSICALFSVFGLLLQFIPMFSQRTGIVLAVTVPVHIALAVAVLRTTVVTPPRRGAGAAAMPRAA